MPVFRFDDSALDPSSAHLGEGFVRAARVRERLCCSGINFIDLVDIPPRVSIGPHRHGKTDEEIYVIIRGEAVMMIDDGTEREVSAGDVIVNPPGGCHALWNRGAEPVRLVVIDVSTDGSPYSEPFDGPAAKLRHHVSEAGARSERALNR